MTITAKLEDKCKTVALWHQILWWIFREFVFFVKCAAPSQMLTQKCKTLENKERDAVIPQQSTFSQRVLQVHYNIQWYEKLMQPSATLLYSRTFLNLCCNDWNCVFKLLKTKNIFQFKVVLKWSWKVKGSPIFAAVQQKTKKTKNRINAKKNGGSKISLRLIK